MNVRQQFITDCVKRYRGKEKKEYNNFLEASKALKAKMGDKEFGKLNNTTDMRLGLRIPEKLYSMIYYVLNGQDEPEFLHSDEERKWFSKKFPEFLMSRKY